MVYFVHGTIGVIGDGVGEKKTNVRKPYPKSLPLVPVTRPQTKKPRLSAEPFHRQYCPRASMTRSISIGFVR